MSKNKGEITSLLILGTVIALGVSALVTSLTIKNRQQNVTKIKAYEEIKTRCPAELSTPQSYFSPASGCQQQSWCVTCPSQTEESLKRCPEGEGWFFQCNNGTWGFKNPGCNSLCGSGRAVSTPITAPTTAVSLPTSVPGTEYPSIKYGCTSDSIPAGKVLPWGYCSLGGPSNPSMFYCYKGKDPNDLNKQWFPDTTGAICRNNASERDEYCVGDGFPDPALIPAPEINTLTEKSRKCCRKDTDSDGLCGSKRGSAIPSKSSTPTPFSTLVPSVYLPSPTLTPTITAINPRTSVVIKTCQERGLEEYQIQAPLLNRTLCKTKDNSFVLAYPYESNYPSSDKLLNLNEEIKLEGSKWKGRDFLLSPNLSIWKSEVLHNNLIQMLSALEEVNEQNDLGCRPYIGASYLSSSNGQDPAQSGATLDLFCAEQKSDGSIQVDSSRPLYSVFQYFDEIDYQKWGFYHLDVFFTNPLSHIEKPEFFLYTGY